MMNYGNLPKRLGQFQVEGTELLHYQYLPVKFPGQTSITIEQRLHQPFQEIIGTACCDYVQLCGLDQFVNSYVYITAKRLMQSPYRPITRPGWHCDGFLTNDINYIWSDCAPTIFNKTRFVLTQDDRLSIEEMGQQALLENNVVYGDGSLLRLNQFIVHKADDTPRIGIRTFLKISFSKDKYDLEGNSINHLFQYNWKFRPRENFRNVPQDLLSKDAEIMTTLLTL